MATNTDPSNLRAELNDAFANADAHAAERVRHLQWVQQARASRWSRTAAELRAEHGADDTAIKRAEAQAAAATSAGARLSAAHQQITTPDPDVAPGGWALHGRVFDDSLTPVSGFTVFLVDAAKNYQESYGFAYTDETGYFLLNYAGAGETSKGAATTEGRGSAELYLEVADLKARPVYLAPDPFTPVPGSAVYQNIVLSKKNEPLGAPPGKAKKGPAAKRKSKK